MSARPAKTVSSLLRTLGSLLPTARPQRRSGRVVRPAALDARAGYISAGLTPQRALAVLQAADAGQPAQQFELYREMLLKWPRLAAVEATRRLALTGLDWSIVPDETAPQHAALAVAAAEHCQQTLAALPTLRTALDQLADAIGCGVAVVELVWQRGALVDLTPVPPTRLVTDPHEPWRLRVLTDTAAAQGQPLDAQPNKWIVHRPRPTAARPFESGLLRASMVPFLAQSISFKHWLKFTEIAGMPLRIARFDAGAPESDRRRLVDMLARLGTDSVAAFTKNIDVDFIQASRQSTPPYQPLQDYCNTEITILWLGQHLTTDIRSSGSRAAAEVHDRVREDLLVDDIADEAATLRRDLLGPLTRARFGDAAPVPHFRRALVESVDTQALARTLAIAVNQLGVRVPQRWAHAALGIPQPQGEEPVLNLERRP